MIADIHTHTFPDKIAEKTVEKLSRLSHTRAFTNGTAAGLSKAAGEAGIDLSVDLPVASAVRQVEHINRAAAAFNQAGEFPDVFSIGCMHPDYEDYKKELRYIRDAGLKGIKVHPVYQDADLDDIRYLRIFDTAVELGLFVITHAGLDVGFEGARRCTPAMSRNVIRTIDGLTLILAHMGGWLNWDIVPEMLADTPVLLDTSFSTGRAHPIDDHWKNGFRPVDPTGLWKDDVAMLNVEQFMTLYEAFGPERLLFGTDSPWSPQQEALDFMRSLPVPEEALDLMLGGNACRVLG